MDPRAPTTAETLLEHAGFVRNIARAVLRDEDLAEDVVQDTWVTALERLPPRPRSLRGWLGTVARHLALRRRRRERQRPARELHASPVRPPPSPANAVERVDLVRRVADAVLQLAAEDRELIVQRFYLDRSPARIARASGVPLATVKTRLRRALHRLRGRLDREFPGGRQAWSLALGALVRPDRIFATGVTVMSMKKALLVGATAAALGTALLVWHQAGASRDAKRAGGAKVVGAAPAREGTKEASPDSPRGGTEQPGTPPAGPVYTFEGRVVNEQRAPVVGARVELLLLRPFRSPEGYAGFVHRILLRERERHEAPSVRTDTEGFFRFDRPYPTHSCLKASAEGYVSAFTGECGPADGVQIVLRRGKAMRVTVVDGTGAPVAGARVLLTTGPRVERGLLRGRAPVRQVLAEGATDVAGEVDLPRAPDGAVNLEVEPREPRHGAVHRSCPADVAAVRIEVESLRTYRRRIVDAATGAPLPRAFIAAVRAYPYGATDLELPYRRIEADADGHVDVPWQKGWRMHASASGYEWKFALGDPIRLRRVMRVEGRVVDPDEKGVPDVPVFISMESHPFGRAAVGLPLVVAWSDAEGAFGFDLTQLQPHSLPRPPDAGLRTLLALHPDHPPAFFDRLRVEPGGRTGVILRFPRPASLALTVRDAAQGPVAGAAVELRRKDPVAPSWSMRPARDGAGVYGFLGRAQPSTDEEGRAVIERLPPGRYVLRVQRAERTIDLEEGTSREVAIVLGEGPALEGRVLDRNGDPIANRALRLDGPSVASARTDEEGRFRIPDLKRDVYNVRVTFDLGQIVVRARPGRPVEIREPLGKARLRITVKGAPADDVEYSFMTVSGSYVPRAHSQFLTLTGPDYLTDPFMPGQGVIFLRAPGHGWRAVLFEAAEAATTNVVVEMPPAGAVAGRVTGLPAGKKWRVRVEPVDGLLSRLRARKSVLAYGIARCFDGWAWWTGIDGEGRFRLDNLAPGRWRVHVGHQPDGPGFVDLVTREIDVRSGETTSVDIRHDG